jgi:hypothetical protein
MNLQLSTTELADEIWNRIEPRLNAALAPAEEKKDVLSVSEAADLLQMAKSSVYNLVCTGQLQSLPKRTKRLYFSRKYLLEWVSTAKEKTANNDPD